MSRSRKKTPIHGITGADSEKQDKRIANRKLRRIVKAALKDGEEDVDLNIRDVSNVWDFSKDGKRWCGTDEDEWDLYYRGLEPPVHFDPHWRKKAMRK